MRLAVVGLAAYVSAFWVVTLHLAISFCLPQGEVILSTPEIVQYFTVTLPVLRDYSCAFTASRHLNLSRLALPLGQLIDTELLAASSFV